MSIEYGASWRVCTGIEQRFGYSWIKAQTSTFEVSAQQYGKRGHYMITRSVKSFYIERWNIEEGGKWDQSKSIPSTSIETQSITGGCSDEHWLQVK
jgi:hypothetical protein